MTDKTMLALSTAVRPARKFTVDGDEYLILGLDHLSADDESEAMALLSRHRLLQVELEQTSNVQKGKSIAARARTCRFQIICKLTNLEREVAQKLPLSEQALLMEAIYTEMEDEEEEEPQGEPGTAGDPDDDQA